MTVMIRKLREYLARQEKERDSRNATLAGDRVMAGAVTVGHIIEISNGYIIVIVDKEGYHGIAIHVPTLDKIGEALAAHKAKQKFLNEPEKMYTLKSNQTRQSNV